MLKILKQRLLHNCCNQTRKSLLTQFIKMQIIHVCPMEIQPVWFAGRVVVENCQEYYFAKLKPSLSWAELKLHIQLAQAFGTSRRQSCNDAGHSHFQFACKINKRVCHWLNSFRLSFFYGVILIFLRSSSFFEVIFIF